MVLFTLKVEISLLAFPELNFDDTLSEIAMNFEMDADGSQRSLLVNAQRRHTWNIQSSSVVSWLQQGGKMILWSVFTIKKTSTAYGLSKWTLRENKSLIKQIITVIFSVLTKHKICWSVMERWSSIVAWSNSKKSVLLIELTVSWEENREEEHERKKNRYETLRADCVLPLGFLPKGQSILWGGHSSLNRTMLQFPAAFVFL